MEQRHRYQKGVFRRILQQQGLSLLLGIVLTIAVLRLWQELLHEELQIGVQSSLANTILFGGVIGVWTLAFTVYLGLRSERYVRQARAVNQQLQQEIFERQHIETELRSREVSIRNLSARLELAAQSGGIGIWDWDIINDSLGWDAQMYRLYGLNPSNFSGAYEAWASALHPDDFAVTTEIIWRAVRGEEDYKPEFRVVHPDGTVRYIQAYAVVQRDEQGQAQRMIGVNFDITDRKQSELVLKESESKYRQLVNHINMGFVVHAPDTHIVQCNETACGLLGLSMEQMLGKEAIDPTWHFLREDGTVMPVEEYPVHQVLSAQVPLENYVLGIHHGIQPQTWVLVTAFPEFDANNQLKQIVVTFIDITARKQTETILEQELLRSRTLFNTSIDGIVILDHQGNVAQTNSRFTEMLGYTVEETLQLNLVDWDAQWTREELQQILEKSIELPPVFETRHRRKDGSIYDTEISYSRVVLDGEIMHFCICRDISDRKQSEIALQNSQARFAGILEIASDAIISINAEQKITLFNKGAERIFGYAAEEVLGQPLTLLMPDRFAQSHRHHINQYAHSGSQTRQMAQRGALFGRRKDGTEFPAEASIAKLNLNGEIIFTTFLRDISERIQLEAERKQSELALRESEARFQAFMRYSPTPAWISDSEGKVAYLSQAYLDTFQVPDGDVVGQSIFDLFPADVAQSLLENIQTVARTQQVLEAIEMAPRRDGAMGTFLVYKFPMPNSFGQLLIGGVAIDITQQYQAETALRESEATKQAIIQAIPDLLVRMHSNGDYIEFISNSHFNITNSAQVRQDVNVYDVLPSNLAQLRMYYVELALQSNTTQVYDHEIVIEEQQRHEEVRIVPLLQDEVLVMVRDVTDRKQSEISLQLSQERLQLALEASGDGLWDWKIASGEVYYSPQYMTMLGYEADELPLNFATWEYLTHPDDQPWVLDILNAHMEDNSQRYSFDYRLRTKSGEWKWIADYGKVVAWDEQGNPLRMIGTHRDVNDRKQAEIALQESAAREQVVSQIIQQMRQSLSLETIFATTTQELRRVLNCDRVLIYRFNSDWSGAVVAESVGSGWVSVIETLINKDVSFGSHTVDQDRCIIKRWDSLEAETIDTYVQETQGNIYNQGTRYLSVADIHQSGFEACYIEFLEKFQTQAYLTVPIFSNNKLWGLLASYQNSEPREWRDSEIRVSEQIVTQLGIAIHQAELFAQVQRQSRELRQAMEVAEAANLAKSMFLANMSHELRTPLNVILGFAQVMSHDSSLTPAQQEDLQTIRKSSDHLLSLINDVLDLSKIEAGHSILEESGFDLISLLHTLRTMMAERVAAKQLQLTFEIAPEVPQFVIADEQKLRQVILNLLSNAIKFTKQGNVTLRVTSWESSQKTCLVPNASQQGGSFQHSISTKACVLQFEVSDTGVGIAATERESIFDAFIQAEAGRKSTGGTGLGLTISRKLLELMNGNISVQSTPGVGSTFTVMIPVCPTSGADGQVEQQDHTIIGLVPGQPHRRILVVDDQSENRTLMVRLLTRLGLEVREATDGQAAIALWQQWHPDLTWMDIRMPGLDGYEATKQIRAMEHEQASIIIALTAQASQSDRTLALAAGCNDYISKPFREETLFLKLKEYLGLEYLYAEPETPPNSLPISSVNPNVDALSSFDLNILAQILPDWLETLEDLAMCGNDRAIVDLANQLAPEFANFRTQLLDLANRFEFEQIVHLIHRRSSF